MNNETKICVKIKTTFFFYCSWRFNAWPKKINNEKFLLLIFQKPRKLFHNKNVLLSFVLLQRWKGNKAVRLNPSSGGCHNRAAPTIPNTTGIEKGVDRGRGEARFSLIKLLFVFCSFYYGLSAHHRWFGGLQKHKSLESSWNLAWIFRIDFPQFMQTTNQRQATIKLLHGPSQKRTFYSNKLVEEKEMRKRKEKWFFACRQAGSHKAVVEANTTRFSRALGNFFQFIKAIKDKWKKWNWIK